MFIFIQNDTVAIGDINLDDLPNTILKNIYWFSSTVGSDDFRIKVCRVGVGIQLIQFFCRVGSDFGLTWERIFEFGPDTVQDSSVHNTECVKI